MLRTTLPILAILASAALLSCGGDSNGPHGDQTPPTVVATIPGNAIASVAIDAAIRVVFSEPIDTATITGASFSVTNASGDYSFQGDTVTLKPSAPLQYQTQYTATVATSVTDRSGNTLRQPYTWTFTTEPDPATTPPTVIATSPANGAHNVVVTNPITVAFSKAIDPATLTTASFRLQPSAAGTVTCTGRAGVFQPTAPLQFLTSYTALVDTTVADTFGNKLETPYTWSFTTQQDPLTPSAFVTFPQHQDIIGDTTTVQVTVSAPAGVRRVQFAVDGYLDLTAPDSVAPFEYQLDAIGCGFEIGSTHTIAARVTDLDGRQSWSDTVSVYYLWEPLLASPDPDDPWRDDIWKVYARSTDSLLEMRFEMFQGWGPDPFNDTALDLGIYFDTDLNRFTGRSDFASTQLNDIGAEYRVIIGLHGYEALARIAGDNYTWNVLYGPDSLAYLALYPDTNVLQFGLRWEDMGDPAAANVVAINVFFIDTTSFVADWVPDQGGGHMNIAHDNRYVGRPYVVTMPRPNDHHRALMSRPNPFGNWVKPRQ